ncbi:MAG: hypothetical protein U0586_13260 [Candidatus Brocadiaceae bacterium]
MNTDLFDNDNLEASIASNNLVYTQGEYKNRLQALSWYCKTTQFAPLPLGRTDRLIQFTYSPSTDTNCLVQITCPSFKEVEKPSELVIVNTDQLSKKTATILGKNGLERFEAFKKYSKGWDGGFGVPLSNRSIAVMEYFISQFSNFQSEPSLFLTPNGNLQLGWENSHGQVIEMEFYPDKIEYYMEACEIEGKVNLDKKSTDWLISLLYENN